MNVNGVPDVTLGNHLAAFSSQKDDKSVESQKQKETSSGSAVSQISDKKTDVVTNKGEVDKTLQNINDQLENLQSLLTFEKDEESEKMIFFIKNSETGEVIRQVPSKEFMDISRNISQYLDMLKNTEGSAKQPAPVGLITNQVV